MKLKLRIFLGFLTLVILLMLAAIYSIIEFTKLSNSVTALLDNNYKTINATKFMLEAVDMEESGVLLLMMGEFDRGRAKIKSGDSLFHVYFNISKNNLTEENEEVHIENVSENYDAFYDLIRYPIVGTIKQGNLSWYNEKFHPDYIGLRRSIEALMELNQHSMYNEAIVLKEKSKRAIMPGIVAALAGIVFTILFNFLINYYYLTPLNRIIKKIKTHSPNTKFELDTQASYELKDLDRELKDLITRIDQNK